jgi:hypothetical protein
MWLVDGRVGHTLTISQQEDDGRPKLGSERMQPVRHIKRTTIERRLKDEMMCVRTAAAAVSAV